MPAGRDTQSVKIVSRVATIFRDIGKAIITSVTFFEILSDDGVRSIYAFFRLFFLSITAIVTRFICDNRWTIAVQLLFQDIDRD